MKKTAMKVSAIIIALCVLFGAFPLSAAAYSADITASQTVNINGEARQNNYGFVWQNKATIMNNREGGTVNNNHSSGYIENNYGTVGTKETSYNYGSPGNEGLIINNYGTLTYNYTGGTLYYNYGNFTETNFGFMLDNKKDAYLFCNQGIMRDNLGTMDYNVLDGTLGHNVGVITVVNTGTINYNLGTLKKNGQDYIILPQEIGVVEENSGTIVLNEVYGEIYDNNGTVTTNKGYVRNYGGGVVTTNSAAGRVYNYGGTVTNNSGNHYIRADLTVAHATTVYGEGFSSDNGIDCWLPVGSSGTATIIPDKGWHIRSVPVGNGITSAVKNDNGSWTVTVGGISSNVSAGAFGIEASDTCTVTIDTCGLSDDIVVSAPCGANFFFAMCDADVWTPLEALSSNDCLFRDLATKPLSDFADEEAFGEDAGALLNSTVTSDMTVYACFYQKIKTVSLTLETPIVGTTVTVDETDGIYTQTPAPVITLSDNSHCTVSEDSAQWSVAVDEGSDILDGSFEYGKTYYAEMLLIPHFGYWLDEDTVVTANGAAVEEAGGAMALYVRLSTQAVPLLGDADGDGAVTVLDATCIQRHLADYAVPTFIESAAKVCGADTVSVLDSTMIQRYAADYSCNPAIGKPVA